MLPIHPVESALSALWEDFKEHSLAWLKFLLIEVPYGLVEDFYEWSVEKGIWSFIVFSIWLAGLFIFAIILFWVL